MSSALKPVLPPTGTQPSSSNSQSSPGITGMAQHAGAPGPYTTGPLSHVSQNLHPHGMNITQIGSHSNPIKTSPLPPTPTVTAATTAAAAAATSRPVVPHAYLAPQDEGTTLPPSQNSAQLMAVHRAQQQHNQQQHHTDPQPPQPIPSDRYKPQVNQQLQQQQIVPQQQPQNQLHVPVQSNGTVTDSTSNKITVPTPPAVETKVENSPPVQNHVTPPSNENDVNDKVENLSTSSHTQNQTVTNSEQKPVVVVVPTPTVETITEAPKTPPTPTKTAIIPKETVTKPPTTMKLATTPRNTNRKRETKKVSESPKSTSSPSKTPDGKSPGAQNNRPPDKAKVPRTPSEERKSKRTRTRTQPYQSPIPELALITKLSSNITPSKGQDEKLIVFYKNEFLAVRNAEGGFYVCQAAQNIYKSSLRIRIRWLSQDDDKIYIPDFYDTTDFDCILTNLNMERVEKGKYNLPKDELERTENILKRALAVESGEATPSLTEEHPDGLDVSLFRDESQLKKKRKSLKRKSSKLSANSSSTHNKRTKKTPDKSKVRKISKSPAPKAAVKKNNQSPERKSTSNSTSNMDKRDNVTKGARKSDGGRAERAKRRGEVVSPVSSKTSPVVDQKKARVLAKVAIKTAAHTSSLNKKKVGKNISVKAAAKSSVKPTRSAAPSSSAPATATASTSSTRRGKKTKK